MSRANQINLLKTQSPVTPELLDKMAFFWKIAIGLALTTALIGLVVSTIYGAFSIQHASLVRESDQLKKDIAAQANKEGIFSSLKKRLKIASAIRANTISWKSVLDTSTAIAVPPIMQSMTVKEQNTTEMTVKPQSVADTITVVNSVVSLAREKKIKDPRLATFSIGKDGITISFTFFPVF